ncbi:DUF3298 and DUF4163 domain-containing protein [Formosa sp. 3Alg 14/1]|uniref:DUF3298 and DUF4163 domain-containing protein n=1 Tax=Formosa sp. 3Alg 14/1 TaxID=3382190 RepID=UPI0039BDD9B8
MHLKSHAFLIVFSLFILASCTEKQAISFTEESVTIPNNTIVDINIPKAEGDTKVAVLINKTLKQYVASELAFNPDIETPNTIETSIQNFNSEYTRFKNQFPESAQEWEAQIDGEVMFKSPEIISISLTSYTNTGGAHGSLVISFLNFDGQTGERIKNEELIDNTEHFMQLANPYFDEAISEKKDMYLDSEKFVLPQNIGYSADGLILLYNTYEIAPYTAGITEFVIPFNKANSYLKFHGF